MRSVFRERQVPAFVILGVQIEGDGELAMCVSRACSVAVAPEVAARLIVTCDKKALAMTDVDMECLFYFRRDTGRKNSDEFIMNGMTGLDEVVTAPFEIVIDF